MVRFNIEELEIFFPYDYVYPEQYEYMKRIKECLDKEGHGILEMPTGTGKTVALFSASTAYQWRYPERTRKIIFLTRTVPEMEGALQELDRVIKYRIQCLQEDLKNGEDGLPKWLLERVAEENIILDEGFGGLLALGVTARRNYCVHPQVHRIADRDRLDESCAKINAKFQKPDFNETSGPPDPSTIPPLYSVKDIEDMNLNDEDSDCRVCPYYSNFMNSEHTDNSEMIKRRIYGLETWRTFGKDPSTMGSPELAPFCPYFGSRKILHASDVIVLNYMYMLDPKVSDVVLGEHPFGSLSSDRNVEFGNVTGTVDPITGINSDHSRRTPQDFIKQRRFGATGAFVAHSVSQPGGALEVKKSGGDPTAPGVRRAPIAVLMDEAHNLDNVAIEALSVNLTMLVLERALVNISQLEKLLEEMKRTDNERLLDECKRLAKDWYDEGLIDTTTFETLSNPLMIYDRPQGSIPGDIRKQALFLGAMKRIAQFFVQFMSGHEGKIVGPLSFVHQLTNETGIQSRSLKYTYGRLQSLLKTLKVLDLHSYHPLGLISDVCTLVGTYWEGFSVIVDPYPEAHGIYDPLFQLACLDSSHALKSVTSAYQTVIMTSGTISPLNLYPKILGFTPVLLESFPMSLDRTCLCPMVVSKGMDQVPLSSRFDLRKDVSVIRNYGELVIEICKVVPDGLVCFFTSYSYMEYVMGQWYKMGILSVILEYKLIMIETKDVVSTTLALHNFRKACDTGRGSIFFSIARGKVSEGIDFNKHYGRAVILLGVPYQYTLSRVLKCRLEFLRMNYGVSEAEFLTFDAMRQAAQCVGRVIRSKMDYGLMIFADARYGRSDKKNKLPDWIQSRMQTGQVGLSIEDSVHVAKRFLLEMAQPYEITEASRLDEKALHELSKTKSRPITY